MLVERITFEALKRECLPAFVLAPMTALSLARWYHWLDKAFTTELGDKEKARTLLKQCSAPAFHRRYSELRRQISELPDATPRNIRTAMTILYGRRAMRWIGWIFDTVAMTVSVTPEKCEKCRGLCREVLDQDADHDRQPAAGQPASIA